MRTISSLYNSLDSRLKSAYYARKDFQTNRHIVVFESDDWGSIRMSNKKDWDELLKLGYAVDKRPYERFDTLESAEDLEALYEVLMKYKDSQGRHPVITANMLMANPDFDKIKNANYSEYYYEPIRETYNRYYGDTKVLDIMRQGMEEGIFKPQSHGREHFNVGQWMDLLHAGDEDTMVAFRYGMCGIAPKLHPEQGNNMMVALRAENEQQQCDIERIVDEGLSLFESLWGEKSKTFVAPCYAWNEQIEQVLYNQGVQLIQTARTNKSGYKKNKLYYYSGERNSIGQIYTVRNCFFEPSTISYNDINCIRQIENTFSNHKLAIVSTHRINYVSRIDEPNRARTLQLLDRLFSEITKRYPDVEFLSSDELPDLF